MVDDNTFNVFTLRSLIEKHYEVQVEEAYNGMQAIDKVMESHEHFKIIFMDCNMPKMNGFTVRIT